MMGNANVAGLASLTVYQLFDAIAQTPDHHFLLQVGFSEIYNEKVYDLLDQNKKECRVHEPRGDEVFVIGGQTKIFAMTSKSLFVFLLATRSNSRQRRIITINQVVRMLYFKFLLRIRDSGARIEA